MQAIERTPPSASAAKATILVDTEDATGAEATRTEVTGASTEAEATGAETGTNEDPNLETTLDDIDNILLRMAEEEIGRAHV